MKETIGLPIPNATFVRFVKCRLLTITNTTLTKPREHIDQTSFASMVIGAFNSLEIGQFSSASFATS